MSCLLHRYRCGLTPNTINGAPGIGILTALLLLWSPRSNPLINSSMTIDLPSRRSSRQSNLSPHRRCSRCYRRGMNWKKRCCGTMTPWAIAPVIPNSWTCSPWMNGCTTVPGLCMTPRRWMNGGGPCGRTPKLGGGIYDARSIRWIAMTGCGAHCPLFP